MSTKAVKKPAVNVPLESEVQENKNVLVSGLFLWPVHKNAPKFVKVDMSFRAEQFIEFLKEHVDEEGFVRVTVKESKDGKLYSVLNNYEPTMEQLTKE